jgi:hypothetical protein
VHVLYFLVVVGRGENVLVPARKQKMILRSDLLLCQHTERKNKKTNYFKIEWRTLSGPVDLLADLARLHALISSYHSLRVDLAAARSSCGIA